MTSSWRGSSGALINEAGLTTRSPRPGRSTIGRNPQPLPDRETPCSALHDRSRCTSLSMWWCRSTPAAAPSPVQRHKVHVGLPCLNVITCPDANHWTFVQTRAPNRLIRSDVWATFGPRAGRRPTSAWGEGDARLRHPAAQCSRRLIGASTRRARRCGVRKSAAPPPRGLM